MYLHVVHFMLIYGNTVFPLLNVIKVSINKMGMNFVASDYCESQGEKKFRQFFHTVG